MATVHFFTFAYSLEILAKSEPTGSNGNPEGGNRLPVSEAHLDLAPPRLGSYGQG